MLSEPLAADPFSDPHDDSLDFFGVSEQEPNENRLYEMLEEPGTFRLGWLSSQDGLRLVPFFDSLVGMKVKIGHYHNGFIHRDKLQYILSMFEEYIASVRERGEPYYVRTFARFLTILEVAVEKRVHIAMVGD